MLVRYKDLALSGIIYHQSSFLLDDFGNFGSNSGIYFEGDMSLQGIGNRPIIARTPDAKWIFFRQRTH